MSSGEPNGTPAGTGSVSAGTGGSSAAGREGVGGGGVGTAAGAGGATAGSGGVAPGGSGGVAAGGSGGAPAGGSGGSGGASAHQFSIRFDYRFDTAGFFQVAERRAALEAAAAAWSRVIKEDFETVPAGAQIMLRNPENRDVYVQVDSLEEDIDDLLVFVGTSEAIPGLGRGGPSGSASTGDAAFDARLVTRRDGAKFEPWAGSISFKASSNFYFDTTPETADDIPFEAYDFTTNATHELGHILGFASCNAFTTYVSGTTFTGPKAVAVYGEPVPLQPDASHLLDHLQSDGVDTLMDPGQSNGIRSIPTTLDLAIFEDLGYQIAK